MDRLYAPWRMAYIDQPDKDHPADGSGCIFCDKAARHDDDRDLIVHRGVHAFVLLNLFPYNNGHLMIAPYQHTAHLDALDDTAALEIMTLAKQAQAALERGISPARVQSGYELGDSRRCGHRRPFAPAHRPPLERRHQFYARPSPTSRCCRTPWKTVLVNSARHGSRKNRERGGRNSERQSAPNPHPRRAGRPVPRLRPGADPHQGRIRRRQPGQPPDAGRRRPRCQ